MAKKQENNDYIEKALAQWDRLAKKYKEVTDPEKQVYVLLAKKKTDALNRLSQTDEDLRKRIDQIRIGNQPKRTGKEQAELQIEEAMRFETFGDLPAARDRYDDVTKDYQKDLFQRFWVVFAAWRLRTVNALAISGGPERVRKFREDLLTKKLTEVQSVSPSSDSYERHQAEKIAPDLADLYKNDPVPEFKKIARDAENKLRELKRP